MAWFRRDEADLTGDRLDHLAADARLFGGQAALVLSSLLENRRSRMDAMDALINSITHEFGGTILLNWSSEKSRRRTPRRLASLSDAPGYSSLSI